MSNNLFLRAITGYFVIYLFFFTFMHLFLTPFLSTTRSFATFRKILVDFHHFFCLSSFHYFFVCVLYISISSSWVFKSCVETYKWEFNRKCYLKRRRVHCADGRMLHRVFFLLLFSDNSLLSFQLHRLVVYEDFQINFDTEDMFLHGAYQDPICQRQKIFSSKYNI